MGPVLMPVPDPSSHSLEDLVSLENRVGVVTGAARGLGRAIAYRLAEAGAALVVGDIDEPGVTVLARELSERFGVATVPTLLDVSVASSLRSAADTAGEELGGLDIWVNNAGIYPSTPTLELSDEEWHRVIEVNLSGTFFGCREAARRMTASGRGGVIVNVASVAGLRGRGPGISHYAASKHGIVGITRQLAVEFAPAAIRVLAVAPTTIITPGVEEKQPGVDLRATLVRPLGRAGVPDDVARVVLFCASDLSIFMSGSCVEVDGGELAR
jgi:NAD(P)-dependent dehydrogenase (short-subunit alcohol dehydrogenase family)